VRRSLSAPKRCHCCNMYVWALPAAALLLVRRHQLHTAVRVYMCCSYRPAGCCRCSQQPCLAGMDRLPATVDQQHHQPAASQHS
jgi:hypothetical protein